jgi:hypothetical protein
MGRFACLTSTSTCPGSSWATWATKLLMLAGLAMSSCMNRTLPPPPASLRAASWPASGAAARLAAGGGRKAQRLLLEAGCAAEGLSPPRSASRAARTTRRPFSCKGKGRRCRSSGWASCSRGRARWASCTLWGPWRTSSWLHSARPMPRLPPVTTVKPAIVWELWRGESSRWVEPQRSPVACCRRAGRSGDVGAAGAHQCARRSRGSRGRRHRKAGERQNAASPHKRAGTWMHTRTHAHTHARTHTPQPTGHPGHPSRAPLQPYRRPPDPRLRPGSST